MTDTTQNDNKKRKIAKIMEENKDSFNYTDDDDVYWRRKCNDCITQIETRVMQINNEKKRVKIRGEAIVLNYKMEFFHDFLEKLATDDNFFERMINTFWV